MKTVHDLFARLGGPAKVGRIMGVTTEHATAMRRRLSIPPEYWPALVSHAADEPELASLTLEALTDMHRRGRELRAAQRRASRPAPAERAA